MNARKSGPIVAAITSSLMRIWYSSSSQKSARSARVCKRNPELKTTEGRPRKYYYSERSDSAEVAAEIDGTDTLKELRMLPTAHGIGFIKLDVDNPADSQVLIPA